MKKFKNKNSLSYLRLEKEDNQRLLDSINLNLFKPYKFHELNLIDNGIIISKRQFKNLINIYRNKNYPVDDIYLNFLFTYKNKISNDINIKEKSFCVTHNKYINFKTDSLEEFLIYTTDFQLKFVMFF